MDMNAMKACLDFVRYCVDEQQCAPTINSWNSLFLFMQRQALVGVGFRGVERMKAAGVDIPRDVVLQWYAVSERIKRRNVETNKVAVGLVNFFRGEGFRTCVLKGQGNTLNYPNPYLRMSGDIDIWVEGGVNVVLSFSRHHFSCSKVCYHHVDAGSYQGVEVEIHYRPSFMNNLIHNRRLQQWCEEHAEEQFAHEVELPDGIGSICVPTNYFNCIYQLSHIYNHLLHEGIGLRQIIDYYYLLRKVQGSRFKVQGQLTVQGSTKSLDETLKYLGLDKIAGAVMWVLGYLVHGEGFMVHGFKRDEWMICEPDERRGKLLLDEIMKGGNFGQYDPDGRRKMEEGRVMKNIQRIKRDIRMVRYFPSECLWEPVFRLYHWFWRQWYN